MGMRKPFTQLYAHLVWATWDRLPLITPEIEPRLYKAIGAKVEELRGRCIAVGGIADHVHCLCHFDPTVSISYLVQQIKRSSSHLMTYELGAMEFKWQGSYGAFTVGREAVPAVRAYVLRQKVHHGVQDLWGEWEETWLPDGWEEPFPAPSE